MKKPLGAALLALSLVALALPLSVCAVEVYFDQFVPSPDTPDAARPQNPSGINGIFSSAGAGFALSAADNFLFPFDVYLKRVTFWTLEENDPTGGAVIWDRTLRYAIWQDVGNAPGSELLGWGEFTAAEVDQGAVSKTLRQTGVQTNISPALFFDQYEYSFELESLIGLSADTPYWISIYLGQPSNLTNSKAILWQQTEATPLEDLGLPHGNPHVTFSADSIPPLSPSWLNVNTNGQAADLRFRLIAEKVPIPGTALLIASLLGIVALRSGQSSHRNDILD
jgi:hypothetical protein